MKERGTYCIHILDPDDHTAIITSIDRVYANSKEDAERIFKDTYPWKSNWLVKAKPTWNDETRNNDTAKNANNQKASKKISKKASGY